MREYVLVSTIRSLCVIMSDPDPCVPCHWAPPQAQLQSRPSSSCVSNFKEPPHFENAKNMSTENLKAAPVTMPPRRYATHSASASKLQPLGYLQDDDVAINVCPKFSVYRPFSCLGPRARDGHCKLSFGRPKTGVQRHFASPKLLAYGVGVDA